MNEDPSTATENDAERFVEKRRGSGSGRTGKTTLASDDKQANEQIGQRIPHKTLEPDESSSDVRPALMAVDPDAKGSGIESASFIQIVASQTESGQPNRDNRVEVQPLPESPDEPSKSLQLTFPRELPGANAPLISLPATNDADPEAVQRKISAIDILFPPPPVQTSLATPLDTMTLEELEELALLNNPTLVQALAQITMSQGATIQAGVSPNPTVGYESDTVGSSFSRDYQGIFASQQFKTAGKLGLQRAAANMEAMNSQLYYERTKLDVLRQVRAGYYNVLVAQEAVTINNALVRFSDQVYVIMVDRFKDGEQAGYEVSQLQSLVNQARGIYVAAKNRNVSAWKQLAVATGVPELPFATVQGRVDMPVPNLDYDALLEWVLSVHPDLQASRNLKTQSKLQLDLQNRIPIPDVTVAGAFQNDFTTPGYLRTSYNLNVSVPVPLFDKNQGNIRSAQGKLNMSSQQYAVAKNALTQQLADAFERYSSGRFQSEKYRTQILPDLARAYRGVYDRHMDDRNDKVAFGDIIVAQQNLAVGITTYINLLSQQWIAATDLANLIQLRNFRDLFPVVPSDARMPAGRETPFVKLPPPAPREGAQP